MVVLITMIQLQPEDILPGRRNLKNFSEALKGWLNAPDYNSQYNHCLTQSPYQTPGSARFQEHLSPLVAIYSKKPNKLWQLGAVLHCLGQSSKFCSVF